MMAQVTISRSLYRALLLEPSSGKEEKQSHNCRRNAGPKLKCQKLMIFIQVSGFTVFRVENIGKRHLTLQASL